MTTLLVKFVALASTFVLLLPAGWCRGWDCCQMKATSGAVAQKDSAPASHSCCQKVAAENPSSSQAVEYVRATSPAHSTADCCCTRGNLVTDKVSVTNAERHSVSTLVAVAPVLATVSDQLPMAVAVELPCTVGPPIRILHCVWRC